MRPPRNGSPVSCASAASQGHRALMRILFLSGAYLPRVGGIEVLLHDMCAALGERGHQVEIITADRAGPTEVDGVAVLRLEIDRPMKTRDVTAIHSLQREVARTIDRFDPDVVHSHDMGPLLWLFQRAARSRRRPLMVTVHNSMTEVSVLSVASHASMAVLLREADLVTAVSRHALDDTLTYAQFLRDTIVHLPNGVLPPPVVDRQVDRNLLVGVGRLAHQKGWDVGIDAMRLVHDRRPEVRMVIAGPGPDQVALQQRIDGHGLSDVVTLAGRVDHAEARSLMAQAALVLIPSRHEGLPLVALEAAWAGRPVVGTRVSGVTEAVVDAVTGVLVEPEHPEELAEAVLRVLDAPATADALGEAARRRA
jgi:glycosyltransferase involved in cell wall biosynthesis